MISITRHIILDDDEVTWSATRSSGAGGQHVNTTDSAVILRFDVGASTNLPDAVKNRLAVLAGRRMTDAGVIVLRSEGSRSQHLNRAEAMERLVEMIREATIVPTKRRPTKPSRTAKAKRVDEKKGRSKVKAMRGRVTD